MPTVSKKGKSLTPRGRVSFPQVYEPKAVKKGDKEKYSIVLLFKVDEMSPEELALLKEMKALANEICQEVFDTELGGEYRGKPLNNPFHKSESSPDYMPPGYIFVRFSTMVQPKVVYGHRNAQGELENITKQSGDLYPGCWAHVSYSCYDYDESGNRGVSFGLRNVQKVGDDEPFGDSASNPEDDFSATEMAPAPSSVDDDDIPF